MGAKSGLLFYCYDVREEEKFQLVLSSLSYEVNVSWNCKCENRRRMGSQPIKMWSLMKQVLRNRFGFKNREGQRQGQAKGKFMESSMGEKSTKVDELSQAQDVVNRKVIHHEKKNTCILVKEEDFYTINPLSPQQFHEEERERERERVENEMKKKSISDDKRIEGQDVIKEKSREEKVKSDKKMSDQKKENVVEKKRRVSFNEEQSVIESISTSMEECECVKSVVSTKESEGKRKESECLIEEHESLKEEQVEEKQDEIEKSEETKKEMSLMIF
ncbi:hypothetical protein M9H77_08663 [Catharanthus roseus]|uniref:Uncharacterized protein n=1 Tax=Catharanthus roseus TaxID=4058 RepID=A0ACC0BYU8_CATRO|nr:hypothetical protein M9H77_08663 [Catharanthus roseus]